MIRENEECGNDAEKMQGAKVGENEV